MTVSISPVFNGMQFFDNLGQPLSGGKIFQYEAGSTSVQQTTFADDTGATPNSNPIVLDSSGRMGTDIWLTDGDAYNLVLTQADGTTVLTGVDDVIGVVASSATAGSSAIWVDSLVVPTFVSPTQFILPGNLTFNFAVGNRVQLEYPANAFKYGTVSAVSFSSPNTQVTLVNDSSAQNSGMLKAYYSLNVTTGKTVDAGAVTYNVLSTYLTPATVGYALNQLSTGGAGAAARIDSLQTVQTTSGSGSAYTIAPIPAIVSYAVGQIFNVKFHTAGIGSPTINVSGLGAIGLRQYSSAGAKVAPVITANMTSQINYDGTDFVVLDQLPAGAAAAAPRGQQVFTSNGTFTVPAGVYSVKVTCVGGGGGGGTGITSGDIESGYVSSYGGSGGVGGSGISYIAVTPAAGHSVSIGAGGAGTNTTGGTGGSTTFGASLVVATGGSGGSASSTGASGYGSVADYGYSGVGFKVGSSNKGTGGIGGLGSGATGTAGTAGMCIVEW